MKLSPQVIGGTTNQEIALAAYKIWESEGKPDGRAIEHWTQAEALLSSASIEIPAPKNAAASSGKKAMGKQPSRYGLVLNSQAA